MNAIQITIDATVHADAKKVWDCYTQPAHIIKWNFADPSWHCPHAENDLRVGGKYLARMEAKDGSFGFDFEAVYEKIMDQKSVTYVMTDGRRATIDFEKNGNKTNVKIAFDAETENPVEMQKAGWQAILNNFKSYTELN